MERPRVTTLIANRNYAQYIVGSILSAKKQTHYNTICVIDDGSTDNSWELVLNTLFPNGYDTQKNKDTILCTDKKHLAFKLLTSGGPSHARNIGIHYTLKDTDYYAILDADDEMHPTKIEKCLDILQKYPNVGIVYADYHIYDVHKKTTHIEFKEPFSHPRLLQECIIHSGSVLRKTYLEKAAEATGWYDYTLKVAEDLDLWLRMCEHCIAYHIAEPLTLVRVHNNNSTNSVHNNIWQQCWQKVREKHNKRHEKP